MRIDMGSCEKPVNPPPSIPFAFYPESEIFNHCGLHPLRYNDFPSSLEPSLQPYITLRDFYFLLLHDSLTTSKYGKKKLSETMLTKKENFEAR